MFPCGHCEEIFFSNDDLRDHLDGHKSQMLQESEIKSEQDSDRESDQHSSKGGLLLVCVKEEEQLQEQQVEIKTKEGPLQGQQEKIKNEEQHQEKQSEIKKEKVFEEPTSAQASTGKKRLKLSTRPSSGPFECTNCSFKSKSKRCFNIHMNQMHLNKYKCKHCPKRYLKQGSLSYHLRMEHKDDDNLKLPEDEFFRVAVRKKNHQGRTMYDCLACTYKTSYRLEIFQHIRRDHRQLLKEHPKAKGLVVEDTDYIKCTECFFKTLRLASLREHIKAVHQKKRDYVCDLCKKACSLKSYLVRHMKRIHIVDESSELHKCPICSYKTGEKYQLKRHLNAVHLKIRKLTCDLCQKNFSLKANLRDHIERIHMKRNS